MSARKIFTPEQKIVILREHLIEKVPVSQVCDQHGVSVVNFGNWQKLSFENGATAFERKPNSANVKRQEDDLCLAHDRQYGIIDCDAHYGDGTDNIIENMNLHDHFKHWTFGGVFERGTFSQGALLDELKQALETMKSVGVELILFLAGGYQRDAEGKIDAVLALHRATIEEALKVFGKSSTATRKRIPMRDTTKENPGKTIAIIGGVRAPRKN